MDESKKRTVLESILKSEKISSSYNKYRANNKLNKKLIIERIMAEIDGLWAKFNDVNKLNRFLESFISNHIKDFLIPKKVNDLDSVVANNSDKRVDQDPNERLKREIEERKKSKIVIPVKEEGISNSDSDNIDNSGYDGQQVEEFRNEENMAEKNETSNLETMMNRNNFQQMPPNMQQQMMQQQMMQQQMMHNQPQQQMNPNQPMSQHMMPQQHMMQPNQPMMQPNQPMMQPNQPMMQPNQPMMQPNQPMMQPNQSMQQPIQPMMQPNQPMMQPNQPMQQQMNPIQPMQQQMNPNQPMQQQMNPNQLMQQQNRNFTAKPPVSTPIQSTSTPVIAPVQQEPDRSVIHVDSRERNIVECPKSNPFSIYMNDGTTCVVCVRDLVTTNIHNDQYLLVQISENTKSVYENQLNREVHFKLVRVHKDDSCAYYKNTDIETMIRLRDINKVTFNIIRPNGKLLYSYVDDIREAANLSEEKHIEFLDATPELKDKNVEILETVPDHVEVGDLVTVFEKEVEGGLEAKVLVVDRVNNRIVLEYLDNALNSGAHKRILLNKFQISISLEII